MPEPVPILYAPPRDVFFLLFVQRMFVSFLFLRFIFVLKFVTSFYYRQRGTFLRRVTTSKTPRLGSTCVRIIRAAAERKLVRRSR